MDNLQSDIPVNDTQEKTEISAPLRSRREFLYAATSTSGAVILSAEFRPEAARASTDKVAELVLPPATKAVTPFEVHVPEAALDDLKRRLANTRWPNKEPVLSPTRSDLGASTRSTPIPSKIGTRLPLMTIAARASHLTCFDKAKEITSSSSLSTYVAEFRQDDVRFPSVSGNERRDIAEVRFAGVSGRFDWDAEAMSQTGRIGSQAIRAWATGVVVGETLGSSTVQPRITLQVDAASGDKSAADNQLNTFNPLFPSGYYFTNAGYTTYANLVHLKLGVTMTALANLKLTTGVGVEWRETVADAIYALPDVPVPDTAGHGSHYVGTYGQFRADYNLTPHIALALEYVHFSVGATVVSVGGHDTDYFSAEVRYGW